MSTQQTSTGVLAESAMWELDNPVHPLTAAVDLGLVLTIIIVAIVV